MKDNKILKIIFTIAPIILVAVLGSVFVGIGMDWFNALFKPSQWIANIVIPIVWTIIYITFAIILILWQNKHSISNDIKIWLGINGILNILWCLIFFTLKQTFGGNIIIILNLIAGIVLWTKINKTERLYSFFLSIYPIWLSIATTLNLAMWILN